MIKFNAQDFMAGIALMLLGSGGLFTSLSYPLGTTSRMGPGYFPLLVSALIVVVGLVMMMSSIGRGGGLPKVAWRQLIVIIAAIAVFAIGFSAFGLVPALVLTILACSFASRKVTFKTVLILTVAVPFAFWLIFVQLLSLNIPVFKLF